DVSSWQFTVASAGQLIEGAVLSTIVNVAEVLDALPQSSVAVNVTVALPVLPQPSLRPPKLLLHDTALQTSFAVAPPFEASHAFNAARLPPPSHSTVMPDADVVTDGAFVSLTVTICTADVELP